MNRIGISKNVYSFSANQYTDNLYFNVYNQVHYFELHYKNRYGTSVLEDNFVARIYTSYDSEGQFLGKLVLKF